MKNTKIALGLLLFVAAVTMAAQAQTQVFVPGTASGCFGIPDEGCVPLVAALTVSGPGTIVVTYVSGTVTWNGQGETAGPNGVPCGYCKGAQTPVNESHGVGLGKIRQLAALMGVFVAQSRVARKGFNALDGTKNITPVGIMPGNLFLIGESKTFDVREAGTLFLGINDPGVADNSGGFNVTVTGP